ncbi:MAG TPA: substrate-binding domain-containing protein [Candidatus Kryptonia bacterium]
MKKIRVPELLTLLLAVFIFSCNLKKHPDYSPTEGNLDVYCAESVAPSVTKIAEDFMGLYQKAHIVVHAVPTRTAIVKLLNNETTLAVCSRPFNQGELDVIKKFNIEVDSTRVALDGVAIIVNHSNPLAQINTSQLRDIFTGKATRWRNLDPNLSGRIIPALESPNSGTVEFFQSRVMKGEKFSEAYPCSSMSNVYSFVRDNRYAIGFISADWLTNGSTLLPSKKDPPKALDVAEVDSTAMGYIDPNVFGAYHYPWPANIGRKYYPLTRPIIFYSRDFNLGLAAGFLTYAAGNRGQKIFLDNGLVPMTVPVNYVQLNNQPL